MKNRVLQILTPFLVCLFLVFLFSAQTVHAKDEWISVKSKNFYLIGNAKEKDLRAVATKLEQFRETFRLLFPNVKFSQPIQTNVVVFKNSSSYNPFRPKLANGKPDEGIAGYFQSGEDVNYITLSTEGEKEDTYGTIFHEYVHYLLNTNFGKSVVPPWFNEGLAEYYQTFQIKEDQKISLGLYQLNHLQFLQQNKLIPLKTFFEIDNYSLHQNGNHSRSIFYAQAWALIHYLTHADNGANAGNLSKFLQLAMKKVPLEKAFQEVFKTDYATMEKNLKKYVEQRQFTYSVFTPKEKLAVDTEMNVSPLSDSEANAYLGDLLYHSHRYEEAETYLQKSLAADANSSLANTSLGLVRMRQGKFAEAKKYLEKAVAANQNNHLAHYNYAFVLSREGQDEFGYISSFPKETSDKMRAALRKAIAINPDFAETYRLMSFINLVSGENLDEALSFVKKGLALEPGNQEYLLLTAQIYLRQEKYKEAKEVAENLIKTADEDALRTNAQNLLDSINRYEQSIANFEKSNRETIERGGQAVELKRKSQLTEADLAKIEEENRVNYINSTIYKPAANERQIVGSIEKISCQKGIISYAVKTATESFMLTSKDFQSLNFVSFLESSEDTGAQIACDAQLPKYSAVLAYKIIEDSKSKFKGELVSVEVVPQNFRLKSAEEIAKTKRVVIADDSPKEMSEEQKAEFENRRREAMTEGIKNALRQPEAGEKRDVGYIEKIECGNNSMTFIAKVEGQILKLKAKSPQDIKMMAFTPEAQQLRFGCGITLLPVTTIITYRPNADGKGKINGELVSLEFVPKSFKLQ